MRAGDAQRSLNWIVAAGGVEASADETAQGFVDLTTGTFGPVCATALDSETPEYTVGLPFTVTP